MKPFSRIIASWTRRGPKPPRIPEYATPQPPIEVKRTASPKDDGISVEEVDTSAMSRTGIQRAWDRMTGKFRE